MEYEHICSRHIVIWISGNLSIITHRGHTYRSALAGWVAGRLALSAAANSRSLAWLIICHRVVSLHCLRYGLCPVHINWAFCQIRLFFNVYLKFPFRLTIKYALKIYMSTQCQGENFTRRYILKRKNFHKIVSLKIIFI